MDALLHTNLFKGIQEVSYCLLFVQIPHLPLFLWHRNSSYWKTQSASDQQKHDRVSINDYNFKYSISQIYSVLLLMLELIETIQTDVVLNNSAASR